MKSRWSWLQDSARSYFYYGLFCATWVKFNTRERVNTSQDCFWVHLKTKPAGTHLELGHLRRANRIGIRRSSSVWSWVRQVVLMTSCVVLPTADWQTTTSWLMCCCVSLTIRLKATTCCKNHLSLWVPGEHPSPRRESSLSCRPKLQGNIHNLAAIEPTST